MDDDYCVITVLFVIFCICMFSMFSNVTLLRIMFMCWLVCVINTCIYINYDVARHIAGIIKHLDYYYGKFKVFIIIS